MARSSSVRKAFRNNRANTSSPDGLFGLIRCARRSSDPIEELSDIRYGADEKRPFIRTDHEQTAVAVSNHFAYKGAQRIQVVRHGRVIHIGSTCNHFTRVPHRACYEDEVLAAREDRSVFISQEQAFIKFLQGPAIEPALKENGFKR
jgi:hypothetical protein